MADPAAASAAAASAAAEDDAVRAAARAVLLFDHQDRANRELAVARAHALARKHPTSAIAHRLVGDLRYASAVRAAHGGGSEEARKAAAGPHLRAAQYALSEAKRLVPDCVDIAVALGDAFAGLKMYGEAETEYNRALRIPLPVDPALHNAGYCMHGDDGLTTNERVMEASERARASYKRMIVEELVPLAVERVLLAARLQGASEARRKAKTVAEGFPTLARAQHLYAYMDLEFVRSLDPAIDKRAFLRRTLGIAQRTAEAFPRSVVVACFHARLLFVLGEFDAAERECHRALDMKDPDDPKDDCIPPRSISGDNHGASLISLACELHELLNKVLMAASDHWNNMSSERRDSFLRVRLDVLQDEYSKVDGSNAFTMSDVQSFVKEHGSWRFWVCPICGAKKFMNTCLLLSHLCSKHPRAVLPRLQSVLDQALCDEALEADDSLDGISFCQESDQQDMICFKERSDMFKWLFYAPSSGVEAKPFSEMREKKCQKGATLLERIKEKMKTLPTDTSSSEFVKAEIQVLWHDFLQSSALDYREIILALAGSFLWRELKRCMTEDPKEAAKWISAADIDAAFTNDAGTPGSTAVEEHGLEASGAKKDHEIGEDKQSLHTDGAPEDSETDQESEIRVEGECSQTPASKTQMPDPPISVTESGNDLVIKVENLAIDTKISTDQQQSHQDSEVQVEDEKSETKAKDTELPDPAIDVAESGHDLDTELEKTVD
ncbi:hypothetical protein ACP4OV_013297 [Aristida adscensionis]